MHTVKTLASSLHVIVQYCHEDSLTHVLLLCFHYMQFGNIPLDSARLKGCNAVVSLFEKGSPFCELMALFKDRM